MIIDSPLELIFRDLFYRISHPQGGPDVFLKLEGFNVTGSIKIKTAIALVEDLEERGLASPGKTVMVESSSGNLGLALSVVCAVKGYEFICVSDPNATSTAIKGIELYGGRVITVKDRDASGGFLGTRIDRIHQILLSNPNAVWLNQYANEANKNVHARTTANEIIAEFPKVDWVFVGSGTTGTLGGVAERLKEAFPNVRIVAVEPVGSVTFGGKPAKRNIPGIGTSVRPPLADLVSPDRVVEIDEKTTIDACRSFARDKHLLVGGSTGSVLAAVRQLSNEFMPTDTIVAISPDLGEKYLDTIYDSDWVANTLHPTNGAKPVVLTNGNLRNGAAALQVAAVVATGSNDASLVHTNGNGNSNGNGNGHRKVKGD